MFSFPYRVARLSRLLLSELLYGVLRHELIEMRLSSSVLTVLKLVFISFNENVLLTFCSRREGKKLV